MPFRIREHEVTESRLLLEGNSYLQAVVFERTSVNHTGCSCFTNVAPTPAPALAPPNPTISIRIKGII